MRRIGWIVALLWGASASIVAQPAPQGRQELHMPWGSSFLRYDFEAKRFERVARVEGTLAPTFAALDRFDVGFDQKAGEFVAVSRSGTSTRFDRVNASFVAFLPTDRTSALAHAVLTVSKDFAAGQGFSVSVCALRENQNAVERVEVSSTRLDVFVSDIARTSEALYLAGSDRIDKTHRIFRYLIDERRWSEAFRVEKNADFLKLVAVGESIYFYASSQKKTSAAWSLRSLENPEVLVSQAPQPGCLFGKGTSYGRAILLPYFRTKTNDVELVLVEEGRMRRVAVLPIGLYQPLDVGAKVLTYLGFDYYLDPKDFRLVRVSLDTGNVLDSVALPPR